MADHDDKISSFCELTCVSTDAVCWNYPKMLHYVHWLLTIITQATEYLNNYDWDMDAAVASYYTEQEDNSASNTGGASASASASAPAPPEYTGPRTLDGRPAPQYAQSSSSAPKKKTQKRTGLATLSSIGGGRDEDDDDDDEEEEEGRGPRDLFAGGEKSGLAVQDPSNREGNSDTRRLLHDILAKAREYVPEFEGHVCPVHLRTNQDIRNAGTLVTAITIATIATEPAEPRDLPASAALV